jgi:hypothetical protein
MGSRKGTEWTTNFEKPLMPRGRQFAFRKFQVVTNCIYLHEDTIETLFTNNKKVVKKYVLTITGDGLLTSVQFFAVTLLEIVILRLEQLFHI